MNNILKSLLLISMCWFITVGGSRVMGQSGHLTASSLALGGGGVSFVNGYHANFVNPANLMIGDSLYPNLEIGLIGGLSIHGGGPLLNVSAYNRYFTNGLTLDERYAGEALDAWFGTGTQSMRFAGLQLDAVPLGIAYHGGNWSLGLALRSRVMVSTRISRGLAELGLYGLDGEEFAVPRPVHLRLQTMAFHEVSLGYARRVLTLAGGRARLYLGVAPKLLLASHTSRVDFQSMLLLERDEPGRGVQAIYHDFRYEIETHGAFAGQLHRYYEDRVNSGKVSPLLDYLDPQVNDLADVSGLGWGLDVGTTLEMDINVPWLGTYFAGQEKLRIGLSLTDVGALSIRDRSARFVADDVLEWRGVQLDRQRIENEFNGERDEYIEHVIKDSLATEIYGNFIPAGVDKLTRILPVRAQIGAQLIMDRLSINMGLGKGFVRQGNSSKRMSFSSGVEYRLLDFIPLRLGMRTGGLASTSFSAGTGLEYDNFEFSIGVASVPNSLSYGSSGGAAWSGLVFRF